MSGVLERFRNLSIRIKLLTVYLLFVVLIFGLLLIYNHASRQALIEKGNQTLYAAASHVATHLDAVVTGNLKVVEMASGFPELVDLLLLTPAERQGSTAQQAVISILNDLSRYPWDQFNTLSFALIDLTGINVADTVGNRIGRNEHDHYYFRQTLRSGRPYASPVIFEQDGSGVNVYFSAPVREHFHGPIIGVVRAQFGVATFQDVLFRAREIAGEQSYGLLLDENHFRLADEENPHLLFRTTKPTDSAALELLIAEWKLPNRPPESFYIEDGQFEMGLNATLPASFQAPLEQGGNAYQIAAVRMLNYPWIVAYVQPSGVFLSTVERQMQQIPVLGFGLVFLAAFASYVVASWIANPINRLIATSKQIADGDLSVRAEVYSRDEVGQLGIALNQMTDHLQQTLDLLEHQMVQIFRQQEQSEAVLNSIDDPVLLVNAEGMITYANKAFLAVLGYRSNDLHNVPLTALNPGFEALLRRLEQSVGSGGPQTALRNEMVIQSVAGIPVEVNVSILSLGRHPGELGDVVVSMQDIGRYKQLDRMKTSFMQHISHELRTPLTSIRLYTRLLRSQRDPDKQAQYLDILDAQTRRLIRISEKVIDASRFANSGAMGAWQPIALNALIEDVLVRFQATAEQAGLKLEAVLSPENIIVSGDVAWLLRAVTEIVENALYYTPEGGHVWITLRSLLSDDKQWQAVVQIEDNGPGIKPEYLNTIMSDDFARGEMGETGHKPGIGLGIAITRMILRHHEGWLLAESDGVPGRGSRFMIILPASIADPMEMLDHHSGTSDSASHR